MRHCFCIEMSSTENFFTNPEVIMNQKSIGLATVVLLSLITLLGCSPDDDAADGSPLVTGRLADLQGTWVLNCYSPPTSSKYINFTYKISGNNISTSKIYHSDSNCTDRDYKEEGSYGNLSVGDNITSSGGFQEYQFVYSVKAYGKTPLDNSTASSFVGSTECDIRNWGTDNYTDLIGNKKCGFTRNTTFMNVFRVVGTNLYLGNPIDTEYTIKFPQEAATNIFYVKQ